MVNELSKQHSICNDILSQLRNKELQTIRPTFRFNLKRLGWFTAYEISKDLDYKEFIIDTPLAAANGYAIDTDLVLLPILRAGVPFFNGFEDVFQEAEIGFVGSWREEGEDYEHPESKVGYVAGPDLNDKEVIIIDTMLATGNSIVETINHLERFGKPKRIHVASVIGSRQGVNTVLELKEKYNLKIWITAIDDQLNDKAYIVPGLGDAGDLSYGHKLN